MPRWYSRRWGETMTGQILPTPALQLTARPIRRNRDELEFLPAILETIERAPSPTARWTALALISLAAGSVAWAYLAHIDIVAVAPGKIEPIGHIKVVQPLETARIRAILVDDGDHVHAGDTLVELDPTDVTADVDATANNLLRAALDAEEARLVLAERDDEPFHPPQGVSQELITATGLQAKAERQKRSATMMGLTADIADKRAALAAAHQQQASAEESLPLITARYEMANSLFSRGLGPRSDVLLAQEQLIDKRSTARNAEQTAVQLEAQIQSLHTKIAETEAATRADAMDRQAKALAHVAELIQTLTKAKLRQSDRRLTAPVDGVVQSVKIHTPGAVVTTADTLLSIVPDGTPLEVQALVDNHDIGFVREGQSVEMKVDAFPFTRYGLIHGTLRRLGRDAVEAANGPNDAGATTYAARPNITGNEASSTTLRYPARIALGATYIRTEHGEEPLQPAMSVSAEIKTGERTVMEFLISPVVEVVSKAGRER